jgi:hypothetical protein
MAVTRPAASPRSQGRDHSGGNTASAQAFPGAFLAENKMHAFIRRFLMHYGIYRRYPLGRFPALRNAWRAAQPNAYHRQSLAAEAAAPRAASRR